MANRIPEFASKRTSEVVSSNDLQQARKIFKPAEKTRSGFTMDNLPPHHYHLGEGVFCTTSVFHDALYTHLRKYKPDEKTQLYYPTTQGMVLSTTAWVQFSERKESFNPHEKFQTLLLNDEVLFYTKVQPTSDDGDMLRVFVQGLNQSNHHLFFNSKRLCLTPDQYKVLSSISDEILSAICAVSLGEILPKAISRYSATMPAESSSKVSDLYHILNDYLTLKIAKISDCEACSDPTYAYGSDCAHTCLYRPRDRQFDKFGILALSLIDLNEVAKRFCVENTNRVLDFVPDWETVKETYINDSSFYDLLGI